MKNKKKSRRFLFEKCKVDGLYGLTEIENYYSYWHGIIHKDTIREFLGLKQWSKFCQGKKDFVLPATKNFKKFIKEQNEVKNYATK